FKEEGANTRITQYSHKTHSLLFFKNLLFQMANKLGKDNLSLLHSIPNRHVGGGLAIDYDDISIDLDYLCALEEVIFLKDRLNSVKSILEIGAGYGRTCHSLLSLFPNIVEYHILDLPSMLALSQSYLKTVANDDNFSKIQFISVADIPDINYDLIINIDSMQEMSQKTVESYLKYITNYGNAFYSKNTIGKFDPCICGWQKSESSELAMNSGILKELVNIFCSVELKKAQERFLLKFLPSKNWSVKKHEATLPWSHYYQALFIKNA
ncbi:MAG TPA: putative sugar O-methyltransferase, partial [Candidatus Babeliales bacterium]|nr:putative sugar O-methyltransferase [Candidatus Babeliales bacterium]